MNRLVLIVLLIVPSCLQAQFSYILDESIPVKDLNNNPLSMPWAGGLNAAQYNTMDLNSDGKDDLVLFDRMADRIITFLNQDNQYTPAPEYEYFFPDDVTNWLLLRDINCDGKKDIFTGNNLGIKVYLNVTGSDGIPAWEHNIFYTETGSSPVLLTKGFSGKINLQLQFDDLPSIIDADGDGDLDIFNVRFVGNGTIEYHQNFSMERYGRCDSLDFERITQKWGGIAECSCGNFAFNNADCPPITGGRTEHAGGKSLLVLDADGDSDLDLLFSEATCTNLFWLKNDGTNENPVINTASGFPTSTNVNFLIFPAAFYEDLDFDNVKDLVAIPNIFSKLYLQSDLARSNWMYKNTGTDSKPSFAFSKTNFLQESMIDVGDNSVPAFADYDGDGDFDMYISQNTSDNVAATIRLYENIGSASVPEFQLKDADVWGFSQSQFYNLKIQFIDIDHDSDLDLAFTATSFQTGNTRLYYLPGSGNGVIDFGNATLIQTDVQVGFAENVYVSDVNRDGFVDLLIGRTSGALELWTNDATGQVSFQQSNPNFLALGTTVLRQNLSCLIADLDGDGLADLLFGDQNGRLSIISNFREATDVTTATKEIIYNSIADTYYPMNLGGRNWPTAVNLFNTTQPTLVVGNVLGGILILRHEDGKALPEDAVITLYPNPVSKDLKITLKIDRPGFIQTYTALGQEISDPIYIVANEEYSYDVSRLAAGIYIIRFTVDKKTYSRRIVIY
ncbi:MAG: FG-GAP-like repeat-containing protein [Chryseolinea sp.]